MKAKKRRFVNRFVKECTAYGGRNNRGSRITNRIIRRKLKELLKKEIKDIASGR